MSRASFLAPFCLMSLLWDCWSTKAQLNSGSSTSLRCYLLKEWTTLSKDLIGTSWLTQPGCGSESNVLGNLLSSPRLKSTRNDGSPGVRKMSNRIFFYCIFHWEWGSKVQEKMFLISQSQLEGHQGAPSSEDQLSTCGSFGEGTAVRPLPARWPSPPPQFI